MNNLEYVTCIICEEKTENMTYKDRPETIHPIDGTQFRSYGHYGSTVFDPMDGTYIDIVICNKCLKGHKEQYLYERGKE